MDTRSKYQSARNDKDLTQEQQQSTIDGGAESYVCVRVVWAWAWTVDIVMKC